MQPLTAPVVKPADDIEAVLGRFQAWSDFRRPKTPTPQNPTDDMIDGVRELSYEEALQSSRSRWQARTESPQDKSAKTFAANPGPESDPEPELEQPPLAVQEIIPGHTTYNDEALPSDTVSFSSAADSDSGIASPSSPSIFGTVLAEAISPDTRSKTSSGHGSSPGSSPGPLALIWPSPARIERQVSMSLRVAASEQALIKARAAEAGLSASAYLRQCALEVENLRAHVHHTLVALERGPHQTLDQNAIRSLAAGPPPIQVSPPGFLARLRQRIFDRPGSFTLRA